MPGRPREQTARDKYPELYEAMTERLPYGGGNSYAACGAWETIDKAARCASEGVPAVEVG